MRLTFVLAALLCVLAPAETEREACQRLWPAYEAKVEVVMPDESRVDLLSDTCPSQ
jgi:hypothetical protein